MKKEESKNKPSSSAVTPKDIKEAIEVIDSLEDEKKHEIIATIEQRVFRGPVPSPEMMAQYNEVEPGMASRLVTMAEKEQAAAIAERERVIGFMGRDTLLGSIFSFLTVMGTLSFGMIGIMNDHNIAGYGLLISGVLGVAKLFISSDKSTKEDNEED